MAKSASEDSSIITSSELNHRTFGEDESWNSLQSTILADHLTTTDAEKAVPDNLTTVQEEEKAEMDELEEKEEEMDELEEVDVEDSNILNVNIDALDDNVFDDCPSFRSPMLVRNKSAVKEKPSPKTNVQQSTSHLYSTAAAYTYSSTCNNSPDSGFDVGEDRTGTLLVQMLEDFRQLDSSQANSSTPKLSIEEHSISASSHHLTEQTTTSITAAPESPYVAQKENYFEGKYSRAVSVKPPSTSPTTATKIPRPKKRLRPRVSQIRELFENISRSNHQGCSTCGGVRKSSAAPKKLASKTLRSPTYHTKETFKLLKSNRSLKASYTASGTASFLLRNQPKPRPSSCSELASDRDSKSSLSATSLAEGSKSRSMNDLSAVEASKLNAAIKSNMIMTRSHNLWKNQRSAVHKKSPGIKRAAGDKRVSEITKRKSLSSISTPVKPVRELRKVFSPRNAATSAAKQNRKLVSNVTLNVNKSRKISAKSQNTLPKIIITKD